MPSWPRVVETPATLRAGLRFGDVGTHTSRTIMLAELEDLLVAVPPLRHIGRAPRAAPRDEYILAVEESNALGKDTATARRMTLQRLTELYGLDPALPLFRVLCRLWDIDAAGHPLLALLCALARDPLLRATAHAVLPLAPGTELSRTELLAALRTATGGRLNEAVLDKVARNAASSWAQAGHLHGRVRKVRQAVKPTAGSTAFALWLGSVQGLTGDYLLSTLWAAALDAPPNRLFESALEARQLGLLRAVAGGGVREIDVAGLDPVVETR